MLISVIEWIHGNKCTAIFSPILRVLNSLNAHYELQDYFLHFGVASLENDTKTSVIQRNWLN